MKYKTLIAFALLALAINSSASMEALPDVLPPTPVTSEINLPAVPHMSSIIYMNAGDIVDPGQVKYIDYALPQVANSAHIYNSIKVCLMAGPDTRLALTTALKNMSNMQYYHIERVSSWQQNCAPLEVFPSGIHEAHNLRLRVKCENYDTKPEICVFRVIITRI